jgi:hypothetical protein
MAGRNRNAKARAQRIERQYFKRVFAIQKWRRQLTIALVAAGTGWLAWLAVAHDETAYSSGPVTPHHASFGKNCRACHVLRTAMSSSVTDQACLVCHDGPRHQEQQISTPHCVDCHVEHRGVEQLLGAGNRGCTSCHKDLKTKSGRLTVASHIESLAEGHPEFAPLRPGHSDPASIKFNHKIHLRPDLKAPGGTVQLECSDCHRPTGIVQPWPYGRPEPAEAAVRVSLPAPQARVSARAYMQPVNYYEHCSSCHPLLADRRFGEPAPHKKPEVVIQFLELNFQAYIAGHPEELLPEPVAVTIPRDKSAPSPKNATEWVQARMEESERLLWSKTCSECHSLSGVDVLPVPKIRESNVTARWLEHGDFDHSSHKMLACTGCHTQATSSERTSDVLVPGIKTCLTCHTPETSSPSARADCFECHRYHDWSKEKPRHGSLKPPVS